MTQDITSFQGEYRWLSNFWPAPVYLDGVLYPSVENAYQAAKTLEDRSFFETCTAGQAKRQGRNVKMRPDWADIKLQVMQLLIAQKFGYGTDLAAKLLATGQCNIIEGNTWGDTYWGKCYGKGENNLGKLLMGQRAALQGTRK